MDLAKIHYPVDGDRKNKMKKIFNKIIILLASFLLFTAIPVSASQINLTPENNQLKVGETFEVKLILNTEDESINAIEGAVVFPADLLILNDIRDGNSIINFWIEKTADSSGGQFNFSGIVPGGYIGEEGQIISLVFKAKKEGNGNIEITKCKALLNNEESAESSLTVKNSSFIISGYAGAETADIQRSKTKKNRKVSCRKLPAMKIFLTENISWFSALWIKNPALIIMKFWNQSSATIICPSANGKKLKALIF